MESHWKTEYPLSIQRNNTAMRLLIKTSIFTIAFLLAQTLFAKGIPSVVVGDVRVQLLSSTLVRLEVRGAKGFEDRETFHVVNRDWPGVMPTVKTNAEGFENITANYTVIIPAANSLEGIRIVSPDGTELYRYDGKLENSKWLPSPSDKPQAWWFADSPRMIPPPQGLTPPTAPATNGGWDLGNDAADVYVFLPRGDYRQLRKDFLKLTGPTEMPPLFLLGAFDSRWFDYSEATALQQIDDYRAHKIPLDVLVVDTGWRAGASTGYSPNTNLFPNMKRFIAEAHAKNVKVLFNDHPEPLNTNAPALDATELNYRFNGLAGLLRDGLDVWWYDRNWWVALVSPAPNLRKEVWGMKIYHDTTARVNPDLRPLIMANVDGIDNGIRKRPMNVASHRYPFQWTGDIGPGFEFLRRGVENAVSAGVESAFPYMSEDLGGHIANPTPEAFIRWIENGALSPVYRPHCTHNLERMPWAFGADAERIARDYVNMRYRLLPVFYAVARENFETGEPLLRRLDLEFPESPEAKRDDEYLLGKDILVAPVLQDSTRIIAAEWFKDLRGEFFTNENLSGEPALTNAAVNIDFDWGSGSPNEKFPADHFSARWTGTLQIPASAGDQILSAVSDDGVRVWLDDQLVINNWKASDSATVNSDGVLKANQLYKLRIEYLELFGGAKIRLQTQPVKSLATRELWLPPGEWIDAWSGEKISSPRNLTRPCSLGQIPIYVRSGAVIALAPEMQFTGEKPWSPLTLDIYPKVGATGTTTIYEDDTRTTAYQRGEFRKTEISATTDFTNHSLKISIGAAKGDFKGASQRREWKLRLHLPSGAADVSAKLNGKLLTTPVRLPRNESAMPFGDERGAPDGDVFEIKLPAQTVKTAMAVTIDFR